MDVVLYGLAGFLFVFFTLTGMELERLGNISWTMGHTLFVLLLSLILGIVAGEGVRFLFLFLEKKWKSKQSDENKKQPENKMSVRKVGVLSFLLLTLARIPFFLAYYPGICAYDIAIQLGQVRSGEYNLHHPLAHTLLLKGALDIGNILFHNATTGIALMIAGQVLLLSFAMAYGIAYLYRRGCRKSVLILTQAFCMFYPFFGYLSVSVTKDVVFSAFFLFQLIALLSLLDGNKDWKTDLLFCAASVIMQLFRNNATYAFLVLEGILFLCVVFGKRERKLFVRIFAEGAVALILGAVFLFVLTKATNAQQGDKREMLSVPIQQMARCMIYHGGVGLLPEDDGSMSEKDRALVNDFLLYESYLKYKAKLADPVKSNTNTYVVRYRTVEFIKTYMHLLTEYPGDMVNAFLALNAGYFYMGDESHGSIYDLWETKGVAYAHTRWDISMEEYGILQNSGMKGLREFLSNWADENGHLKVPVVKYLFVPALLFWGYILGLLRNVRRKEYRNCIPYALVAGYYFTLLLGPCVQLRYLFPLMSAFAILLAHGSMENKETKPLAQ